MCASWKVRLNMCKLYNDDWCCIGCAPKSRDCVQMCEMLKVLYDHVTTCAVQQLDLRYRGHVIFSRCLQRRIPARVFFCHRQRSIDRLHCLQTCHPWTVNISRRHSTAATHGLWDSQTDYRCKSLSVTYSLSSAPNIVLVGMGLQN